MGPIRTELNDTDRAMINLAPLPQEVNLSTGYLTIGPSFGYRLTSTNNPRLRKSADRFMKTLSEKTKMKFTGQDSLLIIHCEEESNRYPFLGIDESYYLEITKEGIILRARKYSGVEYGLQTLFGLVNAEGATIPLGRIRDKPRFAWRGLMIDVSRHFIPKEILLRNLDAMAAVKLNVLHLHLTDDQGFRIESKVFPRLHEVGSENAFYTQAEMKEIIDYAADRGIRVVPEFDIPGHTSAWLAAYPSLGMDKVLYDVKEGYGIFPDVMDPTRRETFDFLAQFLQEMSSVFPDEYVHLGGDEVLVDQWVGNDRIEAFMKERQVRNLEELKVVFHLNGKVILNHLGKRLVGWDEVAQPPLANENSVIQAWRGHDKLFNAVKLGFRGISSVGWYLDHKQPVEYYYQVDPMTFPGAVSIEPDSSNWQAYAVSSSIREQQVEGLIYLFGPSANLRGLILAFDQITAIDKAYLDGDVLSFSTRTAIGKAGVKVHLGPDSIYGSVNTLLGNFGFTGRQVGGSEMSGGIPFPAYQKSDPLTMEEEARIIGGEAAIWTEFIDENTIESRLWPATSAIAEKLWSPKEHTENIEDIYRRLPLILQDLSYRGIAADRNRMAFLNEITTGEDRPALESFVDLLEEVKHYERWTYFPDHNTQSPLDNLVDAAYPESLTARTFNTMVGRFLQDPDNEEVKTDILRHLDEWIPIYAILRNPMQTHPKLVDAEFLCLALSDLSKIAKLKMNGGALTATEEQYYIRLKEEALKPRAGVMLRPVEPLTKLIDRYLTAL